MNSPILFVPVGFGCFILMDDTKTLPKNGALTIVFSGSINIITTGSGYKFADFFCFSLTTFKIMFVHFLSDVRRFYLRLLVLIFNQDPVAYQSYLVRIGFYF